MKYTRLVCLIMMLLSIRAFASGVKMPDVPDTLSVSDYASVISENTKIFIYNANNTLLENTGSKVIFVSVPTTGELAIDEYARQLYKNWGISSIGDNSGVFVLLAIDDMEYWAIVGDHISGAFTREDIEDILLKYMEPDFATGNFDSAVKNTFIAISDWYTSHYNLSATYSQPEETAQTDKEEKESGGALAAVFKVIVVLAVILGVGYFIIKRQLRLYAIEQRKRQRIQNYRKYSRRSPGSGDYEYFEFYDTKE